MKRVPVRDLRLNTSALLAEVAQGEVFIIARRGVSVAELRPLDAPPSTRRLPNREARIALLPAALDSGRILEQDRTWSFANCWPPAEHCGLRGRRV